MVLSESDQDLPDYLKDISKANELTNIGSFVSFSTAPNDGSESEELRIRSLQTEPAKKISTILLLRQMP